MRVMCIRCNDVNETVRFSLDGTGLFRCAGCEEEFTADDVRRHLKALSAWVPVLAWVEQCPVRAEEEVTK